MERRKLLVGMGSLAAGGAAATGTGAFSSVSANRTVDAAIVADENAYLQLTDDLSLPDQPETSADTNDDDLDAPDNNTEYAVDAGSGELRLAFNDEAGTGGNGLNADSTYYFDNVFGVRNQANGDQLKIDIDDSGLDHSDAFQFYTLSMNGDPLAGRDSLFTPGMAPGFGVNVGVKIETPSTIQSGWETGSVKIIAEDADEDSSNIQS